MLFNSESRAQDKFAFLMGISEYPVNSQWPSTYADNDLNLIQSSLLYRGFKKEHIYLLLDSQCTRAGILNTFTDSLLPQLSKGSMVYIHYSGQGQQFVDLDYLEPDGMDEAIVPYDAPPKNIEASFSPSRFILDDELENIFAMIQKKLGPEGQLLITMDCYSAPDRGMTKNKGRGDLSQFESEQEDFNTFLSASPSQSTKAPMISMHNSDINSGIQEYYTREFGSFGLFSYAIGKSLIELTQNATYENWFWEINTFMKHQSVKQNPIIMGDLSTLVFNNLLTKNNTSFKLDKFYSQDLVKIMGGSLQKLEKGTELTIYAPNVEDTMGHRAIGRGIIEQVNLFDSELRILESVTKEIPENACAFISKLHFRPLLLSLEVKLGKTSLAEKLKTHFAFSSFIRMVDMKADVEITISKENQLIMTTRGGDNLYTEKLENINEHEIAFHLSDLLADFKRADFLKNLNFSNQKEHELQLKLLTNIERNDKSAISKFNIGSRFKLQVKNNSDKPQYFTIVNIQADNKIQIVIPFDKPASEYYLEPGQTYTTDFDLKVTAPAGMEVFKLIMTDKPLDLRPVIATRGVYNIIDEKPKSSLEMLFGNLFVENPVTRGPELKIDVSEIQSISELNFEVIEIQ